MNKLDLIQALRDATDLTKQEAEKVVTVFFNDMAGALAKGERVEIKPKKLPFFGGERIEGAGGLKFVA